MGRQGGTSYLGHQIGSHKSPCFAGILCDCSGCLPSVFLARKAYIYISIHRYIMDTCKEASRITNII